MIRHADTKPLIETLAGAPRTIRNRIVVPHATIATAPDRPYLDGTPWPQGASVAPSSTTTYLILDVAGTPCALARDSVREVLPLPHLHEPPASGGPLAGFLNLGGAPLPVLDLARLLGRRDGAAEPDPYRHVLLAADGSLALLVDRVTDAVQAGPDAVRPVADTRTLNGCVEAEIALDERLVHLLSMERILTVEERERVAALARRAAERLGSFRAAATG